MKTRNEVEELKRQWVEDPCWDIEDTEGFEDYRLELGGFHLEKKAEWANAHVEKRLNDMLKIGVSDDKLYDYLRFLERRIEQLEARFE